MQQCSVLTLCQVDIRLFDMTFSLLLVPTVLARYIGDWHCEVRGFLRTAEVDRKVFLHDPFIVKRTCSQQSKCLLYISDGRPPSSFRMSKRSRIFDDGGFFERYSPGGQYTARASIGAFEVCTLACFRRSVAQRLYELEGTAWEFSIVEQYLEIILLPATL